LVQHLECPTKHTLLNTDQRKASAGWENHRRRKCVDGYSG
jgi:hypothetical protein